MASQPLRNIVVYGAGGTNIGYHLVKLLASDSRFNVAVLRRATSTSTSPDGVRVITIDESLPAAELAAAFQDVDAVVSATGAAGKDSEYKLVEAAIKAGVRRFFPSEYGLNYSNPAAQASNIVFETKGKFQDYLRSKENTGLSWTAFANGLWLDWALDPKSPSMGIDINNHTASLLDHGTHALSWTTLWSAAAGIRAALLQPELTANKVIQVSNLEASGAEIVAALEKIQGVTYQVSSRESGEVTRQAQQEYARTGSFTAVIDLITVAFFTEGFGSNFKTERYDQWAEDLNKELHVEQWTVEDAVRKSLTSLA